MVSDEVGPAIATKKLVYALVGFIYLDRPLSVNKLQIRQLPVKISPPPSIYFYVKITFLELRIQKTGCMVWIRHGVRLCQIPTMRTRLHSASHFTCRPRQHIDGNNDRCSVFYMF